MAWAEKTKGEPGGQEGAPVEASGIRIRNQNAVLQQPWGPPYGEQWGPSCAREGHPQSRAGDEPEPRCFHEGLKV